MCKDYREKVQEFGTTEFCKNEKFNNSFGKDALAAGFTNFIIIFLDYKGNDIYIGAYQDPYHALCSVKDAFGILQIEKDDYRELVIQTERGFSVKLMLTDMNNLQDSITCFD